MRNLAVFTILVKQLPTSQAKPGLKRVVAVVLTKKTPQRGAFLLPKSSGSDAVLATSARQTQTNKSEAKQRQRSWLRYVNYCTCDFNLA